MSRFVLMLAAAFAMVVALAEYRLTQSSEPVAQVEAQSEGQSVTFAAFDVFIEPRGEALAAYQVEVRAEVGAAAGSIKIVGIEGGEGAAFADAPYYDVRAMQSERAIIGALARDLGAGATKVRTRVARIHVMAEGITGKLDVNQLSVKLQVAGDPQGRSIGAEVSIQSAVKGRGTH